VRYEARLRRLETHRQRPVSHFLSIVRIPWDVEEADEPDWLRGLRCSCGQRACPQLRIGVILPEKAPSAEVWAERALHYRERHHHA
jgi:hypothetical protein